MSRSYRKIIRNILVAFFIVWITSAVFVVLGWFGAAIVTEWQRTNFYDDARYTQNVTNNDLVGNWRIKDPSLPLLKDNTAMLGWKNVRLHIKNDGTFMMTEPTPKIESIVFSTILLHHPKIFGRWEIGCREHINQEGFGRHQLLVLRTHDDHGFGGICLYHYKSELKLVWEIYGFSATERGIVWEKIDE